MIGGTITARIHTTIIAYNFKRQKYHITHIYVHQLQYEILDDTIHFTVLSTRPLKLMLDKPRVYSDTTLRESSDCV